MTARTPIDLTNVLLVICNFLWGVFKLRIRPDHMINFLPVISSVVPFWKLTVTVKMCVHMLCTYVYCLLWNYYSCY